MRWQHDAPLNGGVTYSEPVRTTTRRIRIRWIRVPAGTTVFDDEVPGVAKLDPALLGSLRQAAIDAGHDGVTFIVNSGWRSPAYEDQLRREAIAKYGSVQEAARWVATGTTSAHVKGDAVDIGPSGAAAWLSPTRDPRMQQ